LEKEVKLQKVRKLSFLGILTVFVMVLFLAGISLLLAQVQIKEKPENPGKPDKPSEPQANWAIQIPTQTEATNNGLMFFGMDPEGYYENNDTNIQVSVEKGSPGTWRKYYDFVYSFNFRITNENPGSPPFEYVGFQNTDNLYWYDLVYPDDGKPCCQFPGDPCAGGDCTYCDSPGCMGDFLNGTTHPHPDYESFYIYVDVFDKDIEQMGLGEQYIFGYASDKIGPEEYDPGDFFYMIVRYRDKCEPDPTYHDIEIARNINYQRALDFGNAHNIVIERLATQDIECDGVWRIWVLPEGVLPEDVLLPGYLKVRERYCTRDKGKATWYYSMEAKGCFNFYIDFIKNPVTQ
jgi:hypothetical protein